MATKKREPQFIEMSPLDALDAGVQEIMSLAEEMRSWYDNMPENFQNGDRGERVSEAADALESADAENRFSALEDAIDIVRDGTPAKHGRAAVEPVEGLAEGWDKLKVRLLAPKRGRRGPSRADRLSDAVASIEAGIEVFHNSVEAHKEHELMQDVPADCPPAPAKC